MTQEDKERKAFEEWCEERDCPQDFSIRNSGGGTGNPLAGTYRNAEVQKRWETWQAAKADSCPKPEETLIRERYESVCDYLVRVCLYIGLNPSQLLISPCELPTQVKADSSPILTEEIIEKMAKTIYDYLTEDDCIWEKDIQSTRLMYIKITKAALAAAGVRFKE